VLCMAQLITILRQKGDGTGSESCLVTGFCINGYENFGFHDRRVCVCVLNTTYLHLH
jgi:hypothetical protein